MMQTASPFYPSLSLSLHIQSQVVSSSTHIPRPHQPLSSRFKHLLQPNHPIFQSLPLSHPRRQETPQRQSSSRRHQQTLMDVIDDPFPSTSAAAKKPCLLPRSLTYHHTFPRRARDVSLLFWKNLPDENPKLSIADSRVVFYTTSLRGIRRTHEDCCAVRAILHGFRVAVDERDVSMDAAYRGELQGLIGRKGKPVSLPQVFVRGRYVGGAEEVRHLHEAGEMGRLLEGVPRQDPAFVCGGCGGVRFVPCGNCSGSRKVFVEEEGRMWRCEECNENGLVRCPNCCSSFL